MKIYLMRHGESVPLGIDDERSLTIKGKEDIRRLAEFIVPFNIHVSRIIHSHKYRAKETAQIMASVINVSVLETSQDLDPMASVDAILDRMADWTENCLLVGHMPFLGKLVNQLCGAKDNHDIILFKPGCLVCLEKIENRWMIVWAMNPEVIVKHNQNEF